MTVWVLEAGEYDEYQPQGVFASEASAWESAARIANSEWDAAAKWWDEHSRRAEAVNTLSRDHTPLPTKEVARRRVNVYLASATVTAWEVQP